MKSINRRRRVRDDAARPLLSLVTCPTIDLAARDLPVAIAKLAATDLWHISWMSPACSEYAHLIGRETDERIVQTGHGPDPARLDRWTFSEITDDSFLWQGEVSDDDGKTWR